MSDSNETGAINRRIALKRLLGSTLVLGAAPLLAVSDAWACDGTESKSATMYQSKPHGKMECSNCAQFCPGKTAQAMGTCKVVEGSISPHGWCVEWKSVKKS